MQSALQALGKYAELRVIAFSLPPDNQKQQPTENPGLRYRDVTSGSRGGFAELKADDYITA